MARAQDIFRAPPERAVRPVVLPRTLDDLNGPVAGTVSLPIWLDWTPTSVYDLEKPHRVRTLYQTVLQTALSAEDFRFLNASVLREVWPVLRLPGHTRTLWEDRFPELRLTEDAARWENEGGHPAYTSRGATLA